MKGSVMIYANEAHKKKTHQSSAKGETIVPMGTFKRIYRIKKITNFRKSNVYWGKKWASYTTTITVYYIRCS